MLPVLCSSLTLLMSGRDKALLESVLVGGVWKWVTRSACTLPVLWWSRWDGHLLQKCTFPPRVEIRENPEFHDLMRMDKSRWPWCALLLTVRVSCFSVLWILTLRACSLSGICLMILTVMMTDGSLISDKVSGASSAGSGLYAHVSGWAWRHGQWEHLDEIGSAKGVVDLCWSFCCVPGPLQPVQKADIGRRRRSLLFCRPRMPFIWAWITFMLVRQVGRLLDGVECSRPAELVNDGDLIILVRWGHCSEYWD